VGWLAGRLAGLRAAALTICLGRPQSSRLLAAAAAAAVLAEEEED